MISKQQLETNKTILMCFFASVSIIGLTLLLPSFLGELGLAVGGAVMFILLLFTKVK